MTGRIDPHSHRTVDQREEGEERGQEQGPRNSRQHRRTVVGAVGALVGPADLADTEDVEWGRVEGPNEEAFRPQRLDDDGLASSSQVCHRVVTPDGVLEASGLCGDVVEVPDRFAWKDKHVALIIVLNILLNKTKNNKFE